MKYHYRGADVYSWLARARPTGASTMLIAASALFGDNESETSDRQLRLATRWDRVRVVDFGDK